MQVMDALKGCVECGQPAQAREASPPWKNDALLVVSIAKLEGEFAVEEKAKAEADVLAKEKAAEKAKIDAKFVEEVKRQSELRKQELKEAKLQARQKAELKAKIAREAPPITGAEEPGVYDVEVSVVGHKRQMPSRKLSSVGPIACLTQRFKQTLRMSR